MHSSKDSGAKCSDLLDAFSPALLQMIDIGSWKVLWPGGRPWPHFLLGCCCLQAPCVACQPRSSHALVTGAYCCKLSQRKVKLYMTTWYLTSQYGMYTQWPSVCLLKLLKVSDVLIKTLVCSSNEERIVEKFHRLQLSVGLGCERQSALLLSWSECPTAINCNNIVNNNNRAVYNWV